MEWVFRVNKDELRLLILGVDVYVQAFHDFVDEVAVDFRLALMTSSYWLAFDLMWSM